MSRCIIMSSKKFIPAMRFEVLTPFFDAFLRVVMRETELKSRLVAQLNLKAGENILDFGCGTGTLTVMIKKAKPGCMVNGIDVDPEVLEIAKSKARLENTDINFLEYDGITLPFADESFDKVATSLVLHHLSTAEKHTAFKEIYRVLKKGGEFHILDIGVPRSGLMRALSSIAKYFEPIEDNILGKIPGLVVGAGFVNVKETGSDNTLFGTVTFYGSKKPD